MAAQFGLGLKAMLAGVGVGFAGRILMENGGFSGTSQGANWKIDEAAMYAKFEQWMAEHNRIYKNAAEKERRYKIFKETVEYVESHNNSGKSWRLGINLFADLTDEGRAATRGVLPELTP